LDFLQRGLIGGEFLADIDAAVFHFEVKEPKAEHTEAKHLLMAQGEQLLDRHEYEKSNESILKTK